MEPYLRLFTNKHQSYTQFDRPSISTSLVPPPTSGHYLLGQTPSSFTNNHERCFVRHLVSVQTCCRASSNHCFRPRLFGGISSWIVQKVIGYSRCTFQSCCSFLLPRGHFAFRFSFLSFSSSSSLRFPFLCHFWSIGIVVPLRPFFPLSNQE